MNRLLPVLFFVLLLAPAAWAAEPSAAQLFKEGVALFQQGKVDAACSRFEASEKLKDQPGTLFNLAACHEKQRHFFEAHAEFSQLAERMQSAGKADKADIARKRAEEAGARAPKLALVFPAASNVTRIELDGKPLAEDAWKQPIFVSAGSHQLVFSATGKKQAAASATAANDGSTRVPVPLLPDEPTEQPAAEAPPAAPVERHEARPPPAAPRDHATRGWSEERVIGVVFAGVGVVGLGVGSAFGLSALSQKSDANKACGDSSGACSTASQTQAAKTRIHSAQTSATISTIGFTAGGIALIAGAYLFFDGSRSTESPVAQRGVRVVPEGPGDGGVSVVGVF